MDYGMLVAGLIVFSGALAAIAWVALPFLKKKQE